MLGQEIKGNRLEQFQHISCAVGLHQLPTQFQLVLILQYITTLSTACVIITLCYDQIWCSDSNTLEYNRCIFRHITLYLAHHTLIGSGSTTSYYTHHTHITPSSTVCVILNVG